MIIYVFLYFLHSINDDRATTKTCFKWHVARNVLGLELNHGSTEKFTEYLPPKNKALSHPNIPKDRRNWHIHSPLSSINDIHFYSQYTVGGKIQQSGRSLRNGFGCYTD